MAALIARPSLVSCRERTLRGGDAEPREEVLGDGDIRAEGIVTPLAVAVQAERGDADDQIGRDSAVEDRSAGVAEACAARLGRSVPCPLTRCVRRPQVVPTGEGALQVVDLL